VAPGIKSRVLKLQQEGHPKEEVIKRTHDLISYYPVDPGMEISTGMQFDEGVARMYDEISVSSRTD